MKPKFADAEAWEQAQLLLQPAYIRLLDNLRKQLEGSSWKESYRKVDFPIPGYELCLGRGGREIAVNLWDLCFKVCFRAYPPLFADDDAEYVEVEIDTNLFDPETGNVDWQRLDTKAQVRVEEVFARLPKLK
ncbi:hypothetical protein KR51_00021060 [Rubidibacter lacunae KORDI 51-2]|uniref:Uncharacterized protein n=1 Tax=Rubidibacter lacunae KORDI 51-2 TaxID=582515 RepID=U5DNM3_9CHRO|nr:hypothetical protein [Rubidibacter lacunae]ERN41305.1 hypothetical protein KR51_00021060 [Rubidibacter lacunae KORDI 51-2]